MSWITKRRALVALGLTCTLAVAGVAFAYFTTSGSGTGNATVGSPCHPVPGRAHSQRGTGVVEPVRHAIVGLLAAIHQGRVLGGGARAIVVGPADRLRRGRIGDGAVIVLCRRSAGAEARSEYCQEACPNGPAHVHKRPRSLFPNIRHGTHKPAAKCRHAGAGASAAR